MWKEDRPLQEPSKKHPGTFNDLYTNLVVAGEEGGILDNILTRLANYIEKAEALKKKVKSATDLPGHHCRSGRDRRDDPDDLCHSRL